LKGVPNVDQFIFAVESTVYTQPKGLAVRPSNQSELLDAIVCVLQALEVCSIFDYDLQTNQITGTPPTATNIS
jgi:hypothetical protein